MENSFGSSGMKLPPQNNFQRRDDYSNINSFNQNGFSDNNVNPQFTSLDGRKWMTKDQEIAANHEYYRKIGNDINKKGNQ